MRGLSPIQCSEPKAPVPESVTHVKPGCENQWRFHWPGEIEDFWKPRCPLKTTTQKLSFVGTHSGLSKSRGSSEGARVIQGETKLCGFGMRTRGTASNAPGLSPLTTQLRGTLFPRLALPHRVVSSLGRYSSSTLITF